MLIDTHCHLHDHEWFSAEQAEDLIKHAHELGVEKIVCIGTDPEDSKNAQAFAASHENIYWTYGIHPEFANSEKVTGREDDYYSFLETIRSATSEGEAASARNDGPEERRVSKKSNNRASRPVAIGEIGLDYHYEGYDRVAQIKLFEQMLQFAKDHDLPVSLHIREAFADAFPILDNFSGIKGVVHSFTGNKRELKQALERGFYIGVNGYATYATPPLPPLDCILLETDAPFLTPVPFRGTINEPGYVKYIATYLAEKLGVAEETIAEQTTKHARELFGI